MVARWFDGRQTRNAQLASCLCALLGTAAWADNAGAQRKGEFSVQRFDPAPGVNNYIATRGLQIDPAVKYTAGFMLHYGYRPFSVTVCEVAEGLSCTDTQAQDVVPVRLIENVVTGDLMGAWTPLPKLQVSLRLPVTYVKGQGLDADGKGSALGGLSAVGLGDPQAEAKYRFFGKRGDPVLLGGSLYLSAPFGALTAERAYIGDGTPVVGGRFIVERETARYRYAANLGGIWRGEGRIGETALGSELRYSVGGALHVAPLLWAVGDVWGSTRFSGIGGSNTLEVDVGLRFSPWRSPLSLDGGIGAAPVSGIGAAVFRAFAGFQYAFDYSDQDGDRVLDARDACPTLAEDVDGTEDGDGCPELDDDRDGVPDTKDRCRNQREDLDGFADEDGCPEAEGPPAKASVDPGSLFGGEKPAAPTTEKPEPATPNKPDSEPPDQARDAVSP